MKFDPSEDFLRLLRRAMVVLAGVLLAGAAAFVTWPRPAAAQFGGNVGTVTLAEPVTFAAVPGPSNIFRNIGQAAHWFEYCTASGTTAIQIALEGSYDASTWFQISFLATATGCNVIETGGYYPNVRADIYSLTGTTTAPTAWYSASTSPLPSGGITAGNVESRDVTFVPAQTWVSTAASSTSQSISTTPAIVYAVHAYNPNASVVYCELQDASQTLTTPTLIRAIPASSSTEISVPQGVAYTTSLSALCTTSLASATAPATGIVLNVIYKGGTGGSGAGAVATVNSSVSSSGTVTQTHTKTYFVQ